MDHSIQPIQQLRYTGRQVAIDSAMIIDAMDLLFTGRFDGFFLVSSFSDLAWLASRKGLRGYGFGERKTPRPVISAFDCLVYAEGLEAEE